MFEFKNYWLSTMLYCLPACRNFVFVLTHIFLDAQDPSNRHSHCLPQMLVVVWGSQARHRCTTSFLFLTLILLYFQQQCNVQYQKIASLPLHYHGLLSIIVSSIKQYCKTYLIVMCGFQLMINKYRLSWVHTQQLGSAAFDNNNTD